MSVFDKYFKKKEELKPTVSGGGTVGAFYDEKKESVFDKYLINAKTQVGLGIGASATGGATLTTPTPQPSLGIPNLGLPSGPQSTPEMNEPISEIESITGYNPAVGAPETKELTSILQNSAKSSAASWKEWFKNLKESKNKWSFLQGKEEQSSKATKLADEAYKWAQISSQYNINPSDWVQTGVNLAIIGILAYDVGSVVDTLIKSEFKVKGVFIPKEELKPSLERIMKSIDPNTGTISSDLSQNDLRIAQEFRSFIVQGGSQEALKYIVEQKGGLDISQAVNIFGGKLYAGLPADEIVKSIIAVGKVTNEMVQGLDPVKVSQVTQQLLNTSPALASAFLKAVETPVTPTEIPKAEISIPQVEKPIKEVLKAGVKEPTIPSIPETIIPKIEQVFNEVIPKASVKAPEVITIKYKILSKVNDIVNEEILKAKVKDPSITIPKEEIMVKVKEVIDNSIPKVGIKELDIPAIKQDVMSKVNKVIQEAIPKAQVEAPITPEIPQQPEPKKVEPTIEETPKTAIPEGIKKSGSVYNVKDKESLKQLKSVEDKASVFIGKYQIDVKFAEKGKHFDTGSLLSNIINAETGKYLDVIDFPSFIQNFLHNVKEIEVRPAEQLPEGQKPIPKELAGLAEEAKKSKDVNEFVSTSIFEKSLSGVESKTLSVFKGETEADKLGDFYTQATARVKAVGKGEAGIATTEKTAGVEAPAQEEILPVKPPIPPSPPTNEVSEGEPLGDPIAKLNELIKQAKPLRGKLERLYTEERAKRIAEVERAINEIGGEKGYIVALSKLKGELAPGRKAMFEPVKDKLSQVDLDSLYNRTFKHPYLDEWEKVSAANELTKLFAGEIPTPKGLVLLEEIYGTNLIKSILSKRTLGLKITDVLIDIANLPRALLTTADMSGFLRQGIVYVVSHPIIAAKAMGKTFQFAFNPKSFEQYFKDLPKEPLYPLMRKSGLSITDPSRFLASGREEAFMSRLLQQTPILGQIMRFAERSYVGFLNKLRVDVFKTFANEFLSRGFSPVKDINLFKSTAEVVNTFTGRGNLGSLNKIAPILNGFLFSARLNISRFNALNPLWYAKQPKPIRIKAIKDFAKFVAAGLTLLAIIKASGLGDVETDTRSSDSGKIRIGNSRWDIWGGFQQWIRVFSQLITGQRKNTETGEIISLSKDEFPFTTRKEVLLRFIEGKLAPIPALINELISGAKTFEGEDITFETVVKEKFIPMYIQDIADAYADGGFGRAVGAGIAAFFGVGVQTWQPKQSTAKSLIPSIFDKYKPTQTTTKGNSVFNKYLND